MSIDYLLHIATIVCINSILALALQFKMGIAGLINLGLIGLFAVGSYSSALLSLNGLPFLYTFIISSLISAVFGLLIGILTKKIKADYLALATLAFHYLVHAVLLNEISLTNGALGLKNIPKPMILGFNVGNNWSFFILTIFMLFSVYLVLKAIMTSHFGLVLQSIRDNELAVKVLGIDTFQYKNKAWFFSSFLAGLAGCLFAYFITFIDPFSFTINQLILYICFVVMGGLGSLHGTVVATIVLTIFSESLRFLEFPTELAGSVTNSLYALILYTLLIKKPKGFFGNIKLQ